MWLTCAAVVDFCSLSSAASLATSAAFSLSLSPLMVSCAHKLILAHNSAPQIMLAYYHGIQIQQ